MDYQYYFFNSTNWKYAYAEAALNTSQNSIIPSIFLMVGIFVVFYVLTILPQKKKQKELENLIKSMKKGDVVLTTGGLYAEVEDIQESHIFARLDEKTKIKLAKWSITHVMDKKEAKNKNI